ncbi:MULTISPECIES: hypothetical protein [Acidithrix]|nr:MULTISPECIES: hypothetical protein [Acidithrix]CAG4931583.1 unnamed protein product [Acidithrix sp. C25]
MQRVSALFKTVKYFPNYRYGGFPTIEESRKWMSDFVDHYNNDHQHSGIKFVTPQQAYSGEHIELLAKRREAVGGSNANLHQEGGYRTNAETGIQYQRYQLFLRISRSEMNQKGGKGR